MSFQNPVFIPGPTNIPESLRKACDMPTIDHRSPLFGQILHPARESVRKILKSDAAEIFIFPSSGTGGWETAWTNCLSAGEKIEIALVPKLSSSILSPLDQEVTSQVLLVQSGKTLSEVDRAVTIYGQNTMDWNEPTRVTSFVDTEDLAARAFVNGELILALRTPPLPSAISMRPPNWRNTSSKVRLPGWRATRRTSRRDPFRLRAPTMKG